jgi:hypothetical protein
MLPLLSSGTNENPGIAMDLSYPFMLICPRNLEPGLLCTQGSGPGTNEIGCLVSVLGDQYHECREGIAFLLFVLRVLLVYVGRIKRRLRLRKRVYHRVKRL